MKTTQSLALITALSLTPLVGCPAEVPNVDVDKKDDDKKDDDKKDDDKKDDEGHQLIAADKNSPYRDVEARALQLFALGRLEEAANLVAPFGEDKDNSGAQRILAMIYLRQGDVAKAGPHVERYKAHPAAQKQIVEVFDKRMKQLQAGGMGRFDHAPLTALLEKAVKGREVDYNVIVERRGDLELYLKAVGAADAGALSEKERLAFFTNAYNAWVLFAVAKNKLHTDKRTVQQVPGFFDGEKYPVAGEQLTLNELEEKRLRPPHGPAAVHFVVNCASVSCPPLRNKAYTGADWDAAVEEQTRAYLKRDVTIDNAKKELGVVKLFEWYEKDFGGKQGVRDFLVKYGVEQAKDPAWKIVTKPYDWRLNVAR